MPRLVALAVVVLVAAFGTSARAQRRDPPATADVARVPAPARHHIPLSGGSKHLIVRGTLNDTLSGPLLIDTGASYCVLTRATAARLGVLTHTGASVPVATANGEVEADLVRLDSIQVEEKFGYAGGSTHPAPTVNTTPSSRVTVRKTQSGASCVAFMILRTSCA